ncbi:MAG: hypothetical protein PHG74_06045, partial [Kiritimatiellae bacterium]|nr:hypothetical protein [Kiritimatiellia bacterium]
FRMVRYYGIYARPVRKKIHALVADALQVLVRRAGQVAQYFARQRPGQPDSRKLEERFAKGEIRCPACGSANMLLIRIWTKTKGVVYEWGGNLSARTAPVTYCPAVSLSPVYRQLTLAI